MAELAAAAAAAKPADAPAAEAPAATEEKRAGDAAGDGDMAPTVEPRPFLPGSASLIEQLDTRVLIVLREGRHLVGVLRSVDQFSNIVLEDTYERHITGNKYADRFLGLYLVKGESLVLVGEINDDDDADGAGPMQKVSLEELREAWNENDNAADQTQIWKF